MCAVCKVFCVSYCRVLYCIVYNSNSFVLFFIPLVALLSLSLSLFFRIKYITLIAKNRQLNSLHRFPRWQPKFSSFSLVFIFYIYIFFFFTFFRSFLCLFVYRLIYSSCVIVVVLFAKVSVSIIGFCAFYCQVSNRTQSKRFHKCTCSYR